MNLTKHTPGAEVGKLLRALAIGRGHANNALAWAEGSGAAYREAAECIRAAVSGMTTGDIVSAPLAVDFMQTLRPLSIVGRLNLRRVPLRTKCHLFGAGSRAYVVGESDPVPLTPIAIAELSGTTVEPRKSVALSVLTDALVRGAVPGSEAEFAVDLAEAVGLSEDLAFIAYLLGAASTLASTGATLAQVDADLKAVIALAIAAGSNMSASVWIMSPTTAVALSLLRGTGGAAAFPLIGPKGGELLGMPIITSKNITGTIALVDQSLIVVGDDGPVAVSVARDASIQMLDNPTNDSGAPTATTMVSMFQTDSVALRAIVYRGWFAHPSACAAITGVAY